MLTIEYRHSPDNSNTSAQAVYKTRDNNPTYANISGLRFSTNAAGDESAVTYTVDNTHKKEGTNIIEIFVPKWFADWCDGDYYDGVDPYFASRGTSQYETWCRSIFCQPWNQPV